MDDKFLAILCKELSLECGEMIYKKCISMSLSEEEAMKMIISVSLLMLEGSLGETKAGESFIDILKKTIDLFLEKKKND